MDPAVGPFRLPASRTSVGDAVLVLVLAVGEVAFVAVLRATSRTDDGDPFDSGLLWWFLAAVVVLGYLVALWRPGPPAVLWAAALVGPLAVAVALLGTVWHDPEDGASFWILGETMVLALGAITYLLAYIGRDRGRRRHFRRLTG